ncbi:NAD(P)/FAD-dependent oxidoreductase [Roseibium salinum]|uniref:FAD-dependent oxidoreductase n=1 Tax=Roseibium salinum TaxID=1604349 RepID=A0ABT3QWA8_9HYPH|nr:FAD-dependent oxidoreductase [Roseibium sp. DSM 29163]MCX2721213.1 FAD-dependent oxidoreductase [Roseibium sp. DSM 29163]
MSEVLTTEIAVIGGGVSGLASAFRLASEGREILVIDPDLDAGGTSFGSAGTIADYAVMPVGTPALLRNLPSLLLSRDSPLSIRKAALFSLAPWMARFAWHSLPGNCRRNADRIARMLSEVPTGWANLLMEIGAEDLMRNRGCLYLYSTRSAFDRAGGEIAVRNHFQVPQELLSQEETAALEPALPPFEGGSVYFPNASHLSDPGALMGRLKAATESKGVAFLHAAARALERTSDGVMVSCGSSKVRAKTVVIAAGAHSKVLARQAGDRVPLDTERGYHVEFDMDTPPLSRPVCPTANGFYLIPMAGRLRAAGTVELGGLTAPPSAKRLTFLEERARAVFPSLGAPDRTWLGFRPSMPDSVPVIRASKGGNDIIFAFGHGHLGLTLAPVTARMVSDLIAKRKGVA